MVNSCLRRIFQRIGSGNRTVENFQNASSWQKLDNYVCIQPYNRDFVSNRGDVLVISSNTDASVPIRAVADSSSWDSGFWICELAQCSINSILKISTTWNIGVDGGQPVQYCLSKSVEESCRVQFSIVIMGLVIGCNFLKTLCLILTLWMQKSQPLVTLGDAIGSFLDTVDFTTENKCLAENDWISRKWGKGHVKWQGRRYRWFSSASVKRWVTCNLL